MRAARTSAFYSQETLLKNPVLLKGTAEAEGVPLTKTDVSAVCGLKQSALICGAYSVSLGRVDSRRAVSCG
jgi:hypothetical protein